MQFLKLKIKNKNNKRNVFVIYFSIRICDYFWRKVI